MKAAWEWHCKVCSSKHKNAACKRCVRNRCTRCKSFSSCGGYCTSVKRCSRICVRKYLLRSYRPKYIPRCTRRCSPAYKKCMNQKMQLRQMCLPNLCKPFKNRRCNRCNSIFPCRRCNNIVHSQFRKICKYYCNRKNNACFKLKPRGCYWC